MRLPRKAPLERIDGLKDDGLKVELKEEIKSEPEDRRKRHRLRIRSVSPPRHTISPRRSPSTSSSELEVQVIRAAKTERSAR